MAKGQDSDQMSLALPPSTYRLASDVAEVVERTIRNYPERLGHLRNVAIACLKRDGKRTDDQFGVDKAGGGFVRTDRDRGMDAKFDIGIWVRTRWWDQMTPDRRIAWVFHLLAHFQPRAKGGGIIRVGHDVEAFADEGALFGAWDDQLKLFSQGIDGHAKSGPAPTPITAAKGKGKAPDADAAPLN